MWIRRAGDRSSAATEVMLGLASCAIAGGMENMDRAPYLMADARWGRRLGHAVICDSILSDGLNDALSDQHPAGTRRIWSNRAGSGGKTRTAGPNAHRIVLELRKRRENSHKRSCRLSSVSVGNRDSSRKMNTTGQTRQLRRSPNCVRLSARMAPSQPQQRGRSDPGRRCLLGRKSRR